MNPPEMHGDISQSGAFTVLPCLRTIKDRKKTRPADQIPRRNRSTIGAGEGDTNILLLIYPFGSSIAYETAPTI